MGKQQSSLPQPRNLALEAFAEEAAKKNQQPKPAATAAPAAAPSAPAPEQVKVEAPKATPVKAPSDSNEAIEFGKSLVNLVPEYLFKATTTLSSDVSTEVGMFLSNMFGREDWAKDLAVQNIVSKGQVDEATKLISFNEPKTQVKNSAINKIKFMENPASTVKEFKDGLDSPVPLPFPVTRALLGVAPKIAKEVYNSISNAFSDPETSVLGTVEDLTLQIIPSLVPLGITRLGSAGKAVKAASAAYSNGLKAGLSASELGALSANLDATISGAKKTAQVGSFLMGTLQAVPGAQEDAKRAGLPAEQIPSFVIASSTGQAIMDALVPTFGEFGKGIAKEGGKIAASDLTKESFFQIASAVTEKDLFQRSMSAGLAKGFGNKVSNALKSTGATALEGVKEGLNEGIMSEGLGNIGVQQLFNAYNNSQGRSTAPGQGGFAPLNQAGGQILGATIAGALSGTSLTVSSAVLGSAGSKIFKSSWNTGQYIPTAYAVLEDAYVRSANLPEDQRAAAYQENVDMVKSGLQKNYEAGVLNDAQFQQANSAIDGISKSISGFGYNSATDNFAKFNHYLYTQVNIPQAITGVVKGLGLDVNSGIPAETIQSIEQNIAETLGKHAYDVSVPAFTQIDLMNIVYAAPDLTPEQRSTLRMKYMKPDESLQTAMRQHNYNRQVLASMEATGTVDKAAIDAGNEAIRNFKVGVEFNAPIGDSGVDYESEVRKVASISSDGQTLIDEEGKGYDAKAVRFATNPNDAPTVEQVEPEPAAQAPATASAPTLTKFEQAQQSLKPFDGNVNTGKLYTFKQTSPVYEQDEKGKPKLDFQQNPIPAKLSDGQPVVKIEQGYAVFGEDPANPDNYEVTVTTETNSEDNKLNTKRQVISVPKSSFDPSTKNFRIGDSVLDIMGEQDVAAAPVAAPPVKGKKKTAVNYKVVTNEYNAKLTPLDDVTEDNFQQKMPVGTLIPFSDPKGNTSWYQLTGYGVKRSTDESTAIIMPVVLKESADGTTIERLSNAELAAKGITAVSSVPVNLFNNAKVLNPSQLTQPQAQNISPATTPTNFAPTPVAQQAAPQNASPAPATATQSNQVATPATPNSTAGTVANAVPIQSAQPQPNNGVGAVQLDSLVGKPVLYKGSPGTIVFDDVDGYVFQYDGNNRELILGKDNNAPAGIQEVVQKVKPDRRVVNVTSDTQAMVNGKPYEIITDDKGTVVALKGAKDAITNEKILIAAEIQRSKFDADAAMKRVDKALQDAGESPEVIAAIDNIFNSNITDRVENLLAFGLDENTSDADYLNAELFVEAVSTELDRFPDSAYAKKMKESLQEFQKDLDEKADNNLPPQPNSAQPAVETQNNVPAGDNQKSETPIKDAWNERISAIDTGKQYTNLKELGVGDAVVTKAGTVGIVKKINPKRVIIETSYGGQGNNDIELMELSANKDDILSFKKPKELSAADKVIDALQSAKIDTKNKVFDAVMGIPVTAWNTSIDTIISLVKAGQTLAQAIKQQYNFLKNNYNPNLDEAAFTREMQKGRGAKVAAPVPMVQSAPVPAGVRSASPPAPAQYVYDAVESNNTYDSIGRAYDQTETQELVEENEMRIRDAADNRRAVNNGFDLLESDARTKYSNGMTTKAQFDAEIKSLKERRATELEKYTDVANKVKMAAAKRLILPNGVIDQDTALVQASIAKNWRTLMSNPKGLALRRLIDSKSFLNKNEFGIGHLNWSGLWASMLKKGETLHNAIVESKNAWDNLSATAKNELSYAEAEMMDNPDIAKWSLLNNDAKTVTRSNIAEYAGGEILVAESTTENGITTVSDNYLPSDNLQVPKSVLVSIALSMRTDFETQGSYNLNTRIKSEVGGAVIPIQFADDTQAQEFVDKVFSDPDVQEFDRIRSEFVAKSYPLINEVYKKTRGVNLPDLGQNYWPLIKSASEVDGSGDEKTSTPFFGIKALHKDPGIIKSRTRDKFSHIVAGDALATMNGYGREIADFIAVEPLVHNFNALYNQNKPFFSGQVQSAGTRIGQGKGYELVIKQLKSLTDKWVNPERKSGIDFMNELMQSFQVSVLAANQGTVLVQSGAAIATFHNGYIDNKYISSSIGDTMLPLFSNAFLGSENIPKFWNYMNDKLKLGLNTDAERIGIFQKKLNSLHKELEGLENGQAIVNRIDNTPTRILTDNIIQPSANEDLVMTGKRIEGRVGRTLRGFAKGFGIRDFISRNFFGQMQLADSSVILMLYEAGKKQVTAMNAEEVKNGGTALTPKEIQEEAAILATRVMYDTQQTFDTTDKSNIQNNKSDISKYITVFSTQPYKNMNRAIETQFNAALDPTNKEADAIASGYRLNYFIWNQAYNVAIKTGINIAKVAMSYGLLSAAGAEDEAKLALSKAKDTWGNMLLNTGAVASQVIPWLGVMSDFVTSAAKGEEGLEIPALQGPVKAIQGVVKLSKDAPNYSTAKSNQYQGTKLLVDGLLKTTGLPSTDWLRVVDDGVLKPNMKPLKAQQSEKAKNKKEDREASAIGAAFRELTGTQTEAEKKAAKRFEKSQNKASKSYE